MVSSELAVKMLFSSIVVIALLQFNTFCTLSTDDENVSDGKENRRETNRKFHPAIDDEVYEEIMNCLWSKLMLKCRHIMSDDEKNIYRVLKKDICEFARINDPVYGREKDRVVTRDEENPKTVPQKGDIDKIVSFFYHIYKGEGARKIQPRIKRLYTGISIKGIQKWLNSCEKRFKINPIFSSKPPTSPVVYKTVQGCNQIDLVDMRSMSVTKNGVEYNYIISLLNVFSRFLKLRPLSSKDSNEVLMQIRGIFT